VAVVAALLAFTGCSGVGGNVLANSQTITITDMLSRVVRMPRDIHRVLALHPVPTTLLELLAPARIVSVDSVFAQSLKPDDARFTPKQMSSLKSLPVTGVYFKGFDPEQLVRLRPDVVITMTGDTNIDREQKLTGIPFFAVSKVPTASYETTIGLIGQIVGRADRADQMAAFWAQTVASVKATTATVPTSRRQTVMYTGRHGDILGVPGKHTVFGSTIDTAGGRYLGDQLPAAQAATENNPVSIEQIVRWDPAVIIVASRDAKAKIMNDPRWRPIKAVHDGRVYVPPQYGGLDGLQAVLGMVWTQGVLVGHDDTDARTTLHNITQNFYKLFYGHPLTPTQIDQLAS
jgi:iron complex transport system substrate-binding protein